MVNQDVGVIFMGTSDYALPVLRKLLDAEYDIRLVVTQPNRPRGRRRKIKAPPIRRLADEMGLEVYQPERICRNTCYDVLEEKRPDIMITASYGQILRRRHLEMPRYGILNVHASLLPAFRGAAPIQHAILNGCRTTGVTIMKTDIGVDTGPILTRAACRIEKDDTAGTLEARLAKLGAELLINTLPGYLAGTIKPEPQNEAEASHAPRICVDDGRIDWTQPADTIALLVRAMNPWPCAFTTCHGQRLKIFSAAVADSNDSGETPGTICNVLNGQGIQVQTGQGLLLIRDLQPACKKRMAADAMIRGRFAAIGSVLGSTEESGALPCLD